MEAEKLKRLRDLQSPCRLCPRNCGAARADGEKGFCGTDSRAVVASFGAHYGEESVLVGSGGSGAIFLSGCNLKCAFCQNFDISHSVVGRRLSPGDIAGVMLGLARQGCENANFVTPTHHAPQVAEAVVIARGEGFSKPVVYNCGGYESVEAIKLLDGVVDIYMPDAKFLDEDASRRYLGAADYPSRMKAALREMHSQVGDLVVRGGVAVRGLLVRHLVMPGYTKDSKDVVDFLADEISRDTFVNVMGQYRPLFRAREFSEIAARPKASEIAEVHRYAEKKGLRLAD